MQDKDDMLPKNVQQDISELAKPDVTEHESAWATYRKLPKSHKWPYFYHHFFWPIIVAVVVLAAIVAFVVNMVVSPKGQGLGVAFVGVQESDRSMDKLEDGFLKYRALDEKKITFENDFYIDSSDKESASMSQNSLETQMAGDTINTVIGSDSALRSQDLLGYLEPLDSVLTSYQMGKLRERGALVEMSDGENGATKAMAIDLGKSAEWSRIKVQDQHARLAFVNVQNKDYARLFVDYLFGM